MRQQGAQRLRGLARDARRAWADRGEDEEQGDQQGTPPPPAPPAPPRGFAPDAPRPRAFAPRTPVPLPGAAPRGRPGRQDGAAAPDTQELRRRIDELQRSIDQLRQRLDAQHEHAERDQDDQDD